MIQRRIGLFLVGPVACITLMRCASPTTSVVVDGSGTSDASLTASIGSGPRIPAEGDVKAEDLVPGHAGEEVWNDVASSGSPRAFTLVTTPSTRSGATSATLAATAESGLETMLWSVSADGAVLLHAVDSHPDGATSLFDPPLLLAPIALAAGTEVSVESRMKIVGIANPDWQRDKGVGSRTVRYDHDEQIAWRGVSRRAKVVEVHFVAALGSAKADKTSTLWVVPGEGIVAERWQEKITILKVFTKSSEQFVVRE